MKNTIPSFDAIFVVIYSADYSLEDFLKKTTFFAGLNADHAIVARQPDPLDQRHHRRLRRWGRGEGERIN